MLQNNLHLDYYLKFLPENIAKAITYLDYNLKNNITEIRLRINAPLSLTCNGENILIDYSGNIANLNNCVKINKTQLEECVNNLCEGSYHAQDNNIKEGFIMTSSGFRIGVCGDIIYNSVNNNYIIDEIYSINMRVSRFINYETCPILDLIKQRGLASFLIYSRPSGGKTTLLRYIANTLSKGLYGMKKYRVALIDERREIYIKDKMDGGLIDLFAGYKKAQGIEFATRTLNPDIIICDEIGSLDDTQAILSAQNSGVPLIATAHSGSFAQLKRKPNIATLLENNVFDYSVGIEIRQSKENSQNKSNTLMYNFDKY